ncbi:hypothetical protein DKK70_07935 [Gilliamella apicola]|uniref:Uncharacterized protein n=1 Tax=Gilliamella apicola TaxID=1196095 RepID=A0A2V4EHS8_9GAMM|nr:hypothetical protein DKK70_07935 [Gilliamella apicola]
MRLYRIIEPNISKRSEQLRKIIEKKLEMYNTERPHKVINNMLAIK